MMVEKKRLEHKRLPREVIQALQNVVGSDWVSEDRAVIEAYTIGTVDIGSALRKVTKSLSVMPACIILPASTEEVQAIIQIANRHKVSVIPFTNGQSLCFPISPGTIIVHLSRMDKILDVDEENMCMTIQPYVDYGTIQAEAMRRGLWNGGSGWHSAIAKPASQFTLAGMWQTDLKYSGLSRNVLGLTVVLPTGEIMRVGSHAIAGTGRYSFTEHFPGPNLLGLFKLSCGTRGIITEITLKLHPWVGEPTFPDDIGHPSIETYFEDAEKEKFDIPPPPKGYKLYWFEYSDRDKLIAGISKIARSGIGIGLNVTGLYNAPMCSRTLAEAERYVREKFFPPYSGYVVIAGISSDRQLKYEEAVLKKIIDDTGGKLWSEEYKAEQLKAVSPWNIEFVRNTVTGMRTVRSGYLATALTPYAGYDSIADSQEVWSEVMEKIGSTSLFSPIGAECPYGYIADRGHQMVTEVDQFVKRSDFKGLLMTLDSMVYCWLAFTKRGYMGSLIAHMPEPFASGCPEIGPNYHLFFRKIARILDPNNIMLSNPKMVYTEEQLMEELKRDVGTMAAIRKWRKELGFHPLCEKTPHVK